MAHRYILKLKCPNRAGIVFRISGLIYELGGDIVNSQQFDDPETGLFFMRVVFDVAEPLAGEGTFADVVRDFDMELSLSPADARPRVLLMVSAFDHCLVDLLYRARIGELAMDVAGVVSNHPLQAASRAEIGDIPFHHLPVTRDTKPQQEARLRALIEAERIDLVVLARYMQILSDEMSAWIDGRCINIHHSFLPSFKGAKPYHQAHQRGVKMIGATAHYVTGDLDEGPIIHQDAEFVTHADTPDDLVRKGRNIEQRVLAQAVRSHIEGRILINGRKTVVFGG